MSDYVLQPYDPSWPDAFERYRDRIRSVAPDSLLGVFHVGSTAVPGLTAKPTIDALAVFPADDPLGEPAREFEAAGFR